MTILLNEKPAHILLVDDDADTITLLSHQLRQAGYQVSSTGSGISAIGVLFEQHTAIDVVILDIAMPGLNGYEVLENIRSAPELSYTQVLIMTSLSSSDSILRSLQAGANDFMTKPWKIEDLNSRIQRLLSRRVSGKMVSILNRNRNALLNSGKALLGVHSIKDLLGIILNQLKGVVDYDSSSIMLVQGDRINLVTKVGFKSTSQNFSSEEIANLEHIQAVIDTGQPVIIRDTFRDSRWRHLPDSDYIASWMGIPLIVKNQVIGLLNIDKSIPDFYTTDDMELASGFAVQAALAIDNAKNLDQLERQTRLTRALVTTSRKLAEAKNLDSQLEVIRDFILEQLHAPMFYIGIHDQLTRNVRLKVVYEMGIRRPEFDIPVNDNNPAPSLASYVVHTGLPIRWRDPSEKKQAVEQLKISPRLSGTPCSTCLVYPLLVEGAVIGIISIQSDQPNAWDDIDLDAFETLTSLLAVSVNNSQAFQNIQNDQSRLYSAFDATDFVAKTDLDAVLPIIVKKLREVMNCSRASIVLVDGDGKPIHRASAGFHETKRLASSVRNNGISKRVFRTGIPEFIEDTSNYPGINPSLPRQGLKAAACVPLMHNNKPIGVLWAQFTSPHRFSDIERETLRLYSSQVATAYESARRLDELEHLRQAAEGFSAANTPEEVARLIVSSARQEFHASSVVLWVYDDKEDSFIPESSVAEGIPEETWTRFKEIRPVSGQTTYKVMDIGWVGIHDVRHADALEFLGENTQKRLLNIGVKSFQGLALKVGEEKLGVLYIDYVEQRGFGESEREIAQAFANQAALALKKAKLLVLLENARQTARIVAEQTTLGDFHGTLDSIVRGTKEVIGCDTVTLYTYDQEKGKFDSPPAMIGVRYPEQVVELDHILRKSPPYRILAKDELYKSEFADQDPEIMGNFTEREGIKSFVGVPLISNETKVGVMCLSFRHRHRCTTSELATIELFSLQAAVAIQHSVLYKTVQQKAELLEALYRAGQSVTRSLEQTEILKAIARSTYSLTGIHGEPSRSCSIGLLEKGNMLVFRASYPESYLVELQNAYPRILLDGSGSVGVSGRAVITGKSQLVNDVSENPDYIPFDLETGSEIAVPIMLNEKVIGVINAEHPQLGVFKEEDQLALEALANYAAIAIHNANSLTELLDTRDRASSMVGLALAGTYAGAWRHAIGNQAVIISDITDLIRNDIKAGCSSQSIENRLVSIENIVREIEKIPMLPLSSEEGVESVLINQIVTDRLGQFSRKKGRFEKVEFIPDLQLDSAVTVRLSREWLRRILDCLIDNAVVAMKNSPQKTLTIRTGQEGDRVKILVDDTGPGIAPEVQKDLFYKVIHKEKGEKGSGLGLFISQVVARTYGGDLEIAATGSSGTSMLAWFPREV